MMWYVSSATAISASWFGRRGNTDMSFRTTQLCISEFYIHRLFRKEYQARNDLCGLCSTSKSHFQSSGEPRITLLISLILISQSLGLKVDVKKNNKFWIFKVLTSLF